MYLSQEIILFLISETVIAILIFKLMDLGSKPGKEPFVILCVTAYLLICLPVMNTLMHLFIIFHSIRRVSNALFELLFIREP